MKNIIKITIMALLTNVITNANEVVIQTGAMIFKKSPRVESRITPDRVRWKEFDSKTGQWSAQKISSTTRSVVFDHFDSSCITSRGCSKIPSDRQIKIRNNGWVEVFNTSSTNTYSVRKTGYGNAYSFRLPVNSELEGVPCEYIWNGGGTTYYNCVSNEIVGAIPAYNSTDVRIIQAQGVYADNSASTFPGTSNVPKTQPNKYVDLTKRLVIKPLLECPTDLYVNNVINWQIYKFTGTQYEDVGTLTSSTSWSSTVFNDIGDGTNENVQLRDDLAEATDEENWAKYRVNNTTPYVLPGHLNDKTCQKKICPIYFNPSVYNDDYCQMQVSTVGIDSDMRIPKSIYVVYPTAEEALNENVISATEKLTGRVYTVPNLGAYFNVGQNTGNIKYRISLKDDIDDLSKSKDQYNMNVRIVEEAGLQKLVINIPRVDAMNPKMLNNEIVNETIYLTASEIMKDFPTRELGLRLKIDINILSPDYNAQRQDLYRCQALDN